MMNDEAYPTGHCPRLLTYLESQQLTNVELTRSPCLNKSHKPTPTTHLNFHPKVNTINSGISFNFITLKKKL